MQTAEQVAVGRQRFGYVAVDPSTNLVYVTNTMDDTVSIIDGNTCNAGHTSECDRIAPTIPAGGNPAGLAVNPGDHTVYVGDNGAGTASFFRFQRPERPTRVTAATLHGQVKLLWSHTYDGGLPIVYHVIPSPACSTCSGLSTPATSGVPLTTIGGLTPGQTYKFRVKASDAAGSGPVSTPPTRLLRNRTWHMTAQTEAKARTA